MSNRTGAFAMLAALAVACVQPPPSDREEPPRSDGGSRADEIAKKPDCRIDSKTASFDEGESTLTEQERRMVFRDVLDLRERALREAQKEFPSPQAQGLSGPGQATKELAVETARRQQAESLEGFYVGQFLLVRQLSCDELRRIFREGLEKGWTQR